MKTITWPRCQFLPIIMILFGITCRSGWAEIEIDASKPSGVQVAYFGWDLKGWQDTTSRPERAKDLFGEVPANLLRIPMFATAHAADGKIDLEAYGPMLTSIRNVLEVNPEVKIFASVKLAKEKTFPAWIDSTEDGKIFDAVVKKPDPAKYARLTADYIGWLLGEGISIDFLGLGNETTGALDAERYVETVDLLRKELEKRGYEARFTSFKLVGPDSFGVPTALDFSQKVKRGRGRNSVDVWGSHFYPDLESGSIEDWEELADIANGKPVWHTELHVRSSDDDQNITKIRDGLAIVFATNREGVSGFVWWARAFESGKMVNLIRRQVTRSMLGGYCIKTSGRYDAKDNKPTAAVIQATRVGDRVYLWVCNPGGERKAEAVKLTGAKAAELSGILWQGGDTVSPTTQTVLDLAPPPSGGSIALPALPAKSIALISIELEGAGGRAVKVLVEERDWNSSKPGSKSVRAALLSIKDGVGTFRRPDGNTFDYPLQNLDDEGRRIALEAAEN